MVMPFFGRGGGTQYAKYHEFIITKLKENQKMLVTPIVENDSKFYKFWYN